MKIKEWFFELLGTTAVVLLAPAQWRDVYRTPAAPVECDKPSRPHQVRSV